MQERRAIQGAKATNGCKGKKHWKWTWILTMRRERDWASQPQLFHAKKLRWCPEIQRSSLDISCIMKNSSAVSTFGLMPLLNSCTCLWMYCRKASLDHLLINVIIKSGTCKRYINMWLQWSDFVFCWDVGQCWWGYLGWFHCWTRFIVLLMPIVILGRVGDDQIILEWWCHFALLIFGTQR